MRKVVNVHYIALQVLFRQLNAFFLLTFKRNLLTISKIWRNGSVVLKTILEIFALFLSNKFCEGLLVYHIFRRTTFNSIIAFDTLYFVIRFKDERIFTRYFIWIFKKKIQFLWQIYWHFLNTNWFVIHRIVFCSLYFLENVFCKVFWRESQINCMLILNIRWRYRNLLSELFLSEGRTNNTFNFSYHFKNVFITTV